MEALKRKQAELRQIARGNVQCSSRRNLGRTEMEIEKGDQVMLRRNILGDSLTERFSGPFEIVERRDSDVNLALPRGEKWVHIDNIKKFMGNAPRPEETARTAEIISMSPNEARGENSFILEISAYC